MVPNENAVQVSSRSYCSVILGTLPDLYNEERYCDVTFYCQGGKIVKAHRLSLSSVSPFLHDLFTRQVPGENVEISLPDIDSSDVDNLMRYIYEGLIRLEEKEYLQFLELTKMLGLCIPSSVVHGDRPEKEQWKDIESGCPSHVSRKRKLSEDSVNSDSKKIYKQNSRQELVSSLNNIITNLSSKSNNIGHETLTKSSSGQPILVPIEYYTKAADILAKRKALKHLDSAVTEIVKEQLNLVLKKRKERAKERHQKVMPLSPLLKASETQSQLVRSHEATPSVVSNPLFKGQVDQELERHKGRAIEFHQKLRPEALHSKASEIQSEPAKSIEKNTLSNQPMVKIGPPVLSTRNAHGNVITASAATSQLRPVQSP